MRACPLGLLSRARMRIRSRIHILHIYFEFDPFYIKRPLLVAGGWNLADGLDRAPHYAHHSQNNGRFGIVLTYFRAPDIKIRSYESLKPKSLWCIRILIVLMLWPLLVMMMCIHHKTWIVDVVMYQIICCN